MLAGTAGYKPHSTQLLYFLYIIKSADISHLRKNSCKDVFANPVDFQDIFCMWYFHAFLIQYIFNLRQLFMGLSL